MDRVDDMPEVEITGRRRRESRDAARPDAVKPQNTYFNPNWIWRESKRVLVMTP
jgi:hypothetical protein